MAMTVPFTYSLIIPFSAQTKQGRDEIWELIESFYIEEEGESNDETIHPEEPPTHP